MDQEDKINLLKTELTNNLEVDFNDDQNSEQQLFEMIRQRVEELLNTQPELLMSYLYRLDVKENLVREALHDHENAIEKISQLILDRQLLRVHTKLNLKQRPIQGWEW